MPKLKKLSRREQEVLEVLYKLGEASAKEIEKELPNAPGNSSIRTHLRNLVNKGFACSRESGLMYVYCPAHDIGEISQSALSELVNTFFKGKPALAVNQLLNLNLDEISDQDLEELEQMIRSHRARKNE